MKDVGFVGIEFKADVTQDKVQDIINSLYAENKNAIDGMWYLQVADRNSMDDVKQNIEKTYSV